MINKKQKNAIKSPYLGILCRNERMDMIVIETLYYTSNKINIIQIFYYIRIINDIIYKNPPFIKTPTE
jgi:hypothetical protein